MNEKLKAILAELRMRSIGTATHFEEIYGSKQGLFSILITGLQLYNKLLSNHRLAAQTDIY